MPEEQEFEEQDSSIPDVDTTDENSGEENEPKQEINWQERANSAGKVIEDLKELAGVTKVKDLKVKLTTPVERRPSENIEEAKAELRLEFQGFSKEEIDAAKRLKPSMAVDQAVLDPMVKAAINGIRQSHLVDEAIPSGSSTVPLYQGKTFQELNPQEQKANYQNVVAKAIDRGKGKGTRSSI